MPWTVPKDLELCSSSKSKKPLGKTDDENDDDENNDDENDEIDDNENNDETFDKAKNTHLCCQQSLLHRMTVTMILMTTSPWQ